MKIRMLFRASDERGGGLFPIDWNAEPHHVGVRIDQYIRAMPGRLVRVERLGYPYEIPSVESLIAAKRSAS